MALTIPARSMTAGSKRTVARSVARLTFASATPSARARNRSMRFTQLAQVIPITGTVSSAGAVGEAVVLIGAAQGYYRGVSDPDVAEGAPGGRVVWARARVDPDERVPAGGLRRGRDPRRRADAPPSRPDRGRRAHVRDPLGGHGGLARARLRAGSRSLARRSPAATGARGALPRPGHADRSGRGRHRPRP